MNSLEQLGQASQKVVQLHLISHALCWEAHHVSHLAPLAVVLSFSALLCDDDVVLTVYNFVYIYSPTKNFLHMSAQAYHTYQSIRHTRRKTAIGISLSILKCWRYTACHSCLSRHCLLSMWREHGIWDMNHKTLTMCIGDSSLFHLLSDNTNFDILEMKRNEGIITGS